MRRLVGPPEKNPCGATAKAYYYTLIIEKLDHEFSKLMTKSQICCSKQCN